MSFSRPSKIYPNCVFWSENMPSGNPVAGNNPSCFNKEEMNDSKHEERTLFINFDMKK
jgi:hypothetical protein